MTETTDAITRAMSRAYPPIIMTLEDVADVCGMSYSHVKSVIQHQPHFPAKLERFTSPRWSRDSILEWAKVI